MEYMSSSPRTMELPKPERVPCPYEETYTCDVAVVGCGFAGLNAAYAARQEGRQVLVIDKGRPGYSGLSPWPSSFRWFDPERGDDAGAFRRAMMVGGDYLSNLNWYECWLKESKGMFQRLTDWGILAQYPKAAEVGDFYEREDMVGYRETFDRFDRHKKWVEVLERSGIPFLEHTMVSDVLTQEGRTAGVLAFHVPSGQVVAVRAKAVILATGGGCYKPTGYPVGGDTFDGEYMAYQLGLPIAGKEFEDFHNTSSTAPGNVLIDNHWQYLENIWLCGGDVTPSSVVGYAAAKGNVMVLGRVRQGMNGVPAVDGAGVQNVANAVYTRRGGAQHYETDPEELRSGKMSTPVAVSDLAGAAAGMCCHLSSGVFCGLEETDCATAVPGLFVAGDGIHATSPSGTAYPCGVGFTSCFTSIDGDHAGRSAAAYAARTAGVPLPGEALEQKKAQLLAPMHVETGFDPNWARDILHSIMSPYWITCVKDETMLKAALTQVEYLRDHVAPKLAARCGHDLRLCHEMKHKILSAELKLRAGLARRESRGTHYRADIPYRDDAGFLCYITQRKDGTENVLEYIPVPEAWQGDKTLPYEERYVYYFPGEPEAKGFTPPERTFGKHKPQEGRKGGGRA